MIESRTGNMRQGLLDFIAFIGRNHNLKSLELLEVGSYKGDSARLFANRFKHVYCVDAWEKELFNVPADVTEAEKEFDCVVIDCGNITKIKGRSLEVVKEFSANVDVIYIDASHDYKSVRADILAWKDKATLYVCGHDYWTNKFPGVVKAVNEIFNKPNLTFKDTSWIVAK